MTVQLRGEKPVINKLKTPDLILNTANIPAEKEKVYLNCEFLPASKNMAAVNSTVMPEGCGSRINLYA